VAQNIIIILFDACNRINLITKRRAERDGEIEPQIEFSYHNKKMMKSNYFAMQFNYK
jgi:hypothetical protein